MTTEHPDPDLSPADMVDAMEREVVDHDLVDTADSDDDTPAHELDLDPEDQGSADAAAANPD